MSSLSTPPPASALFVSTLLTGDYNPRSPRNRMSPVSHHHASACSTEHNTRTRLVHFSSISRYIHYWRHTVEFVGHRIPSDHHMVARAVLAGLYHEYQIAKTAA